jgi:acetamidase/formamidase
VTRLDAGADRVEFWPGIRIPVAPFCGVIGVAPTAGPLSTIPPDVHGGNMDTRHLVAGSTLFLPVFQPDARLSAGDGPMRPRADGEVSRGTGHRIRRCGPQPAPRRFARILHPRSPPRSSPAAGPARGAAQRRALSRPTGSRARTCLIAAARDAVRRMNRVLSREHGLEPVQAYLLCSVAVDCGSARSWTCRTSSSRPTARWDLRVGR